MNPLTQTLPSALLALLLGCSHSSNAAGFEKPAGIYINWAAYDELSDNVRLDEALAMRQFQEMVRLRKLGVQMDYYVMDCCWFDREGGYRQWRKGSWPEGPDRWLKACKENGIKPGLWISSNTLFARMAVPEKWKDSHDPATKSMAMFEGGFLEDLIDVMQLWVDHGVEMFKFDFVHFGSAGASKDIPVNLVREKNRAAFHKAMMAFRKRNPQVRALAYNGFIDIPLKPTLPELRKWPAAPKYLGQLLDVFDGIYCGDPALADVPTQSFWRSKDIYSDHQVRNWEFIGVPLDRIDSSSFMVATTNTCYGRRTSGWKTMLLLSLARGGWSNTYYGDLSLLSDEDARWFAEAQSIFLPLQAKHAISSFGAVPASVKPYGFLAKEDAGALVTFINPQQSFAKVKLPVPGKGRLLFADSGFTPTVDEDGVTLGPEQMAVVGVGSYAEAKFELGRDADVRIPVELEPVKAELVKLGKNSATATIAGGLPVGKNVRIMWQQFDEKGIPKRSIVFADKGTAGKVLSILAEQEGRPVPVKINYDKAIWSGLSWAAGEIKSTDLDPAKPLKLTFTSLEPQTVEIRAQVHAVKY
jgi:hypothetical protein